LLLLLCGQHLLHHLAQRVDLLLKGWNHTRVLVDRTTNGSVACRRGALDASFRRANRSREVAI
jgi:hypothetical protein